jgi:hypothetical protein
LITTKHYQQCHRDPVLLNKAQSRSIKCFMRPPSTELRRGQKLAEASIRNPLPTLYGGDSGACLAVREPQAVLGVDLVPQPVSHRLARSIAKISEAP